jgi:hypothetical protein
MRTITLLMLITLVATTTLGNSRDWKPARIVEESETNRSGELRKSKNTVHYTVETADRLYYVDYTYDPDKKSNNRPPDLAVNVYTKIAIEGKHAYILDTTGKEVKMEIVKKSASK